MAGQYIRYYVIFEGQIEQVGWERRRRFLGRKGQKHPLVCVLYTREKGMVKTIVSVSVDCGRKGVCK